MIVAPPEQLQPYSRCSSSSSNNSNNSSSNNKPSTYTIRKQLAREKAERYFHKRYCESASQSVLLSTPTKFSRQEVLVGDVLGEGAFGVVWEVNDIHLDNSCLDSSSLVDSSLPDADNRMFLAEHCIRNPNHQPRYAMKALSKVTVKDTNLLCQGILDLVTEARLLSQIDPHPNIIKMRAVADTNPFHEDFFIVVDRLYGTLEDRFNDWKIQEQQQQLPKVAALWNALSSERRTRRQQQQRLTLWEPRYQACHDLASALEHLHQHRIVHRDIKPPNIGYNIRGDLTLFDFGLSRELPAQPDQDELYKMTGYVGSPRYMAPEIANYHPLYNEQCDVYSFAVLAWQILTLEKPYEGCQIDQIRVQVWQKPCGRPELTRLRHHGKLQSLIDQAWSHEWKDRPTMREIRTIFRQELIGIHNNDATGQCESSSQSSIGKDQRRSTFIFPLETEDPTCPSDVK
jgi:serine/threonine protein kinase